MFGDDKTLLDSDKDLKSLIERFLKLLEPLLEWCGNKKLDLNWSKTYFMFITNKRVRLPHEILINSKTTVQVVKTFKL